MAKTIALTPTQRKVIVNELVHNCSCQKTKVFNEEDRDVLEGTTDARLLDLLNNLKRVAQNERIATAARRGLMVGNRRMGLTINAEGEMAVLAPQPIEEEVDSVEQREECDPADPDCDNPAQAEQGDSEATGPPANEPNMEDPGSPADTGGAPPEEKPATNSRRRLSEAAWLQNAPASIREDLALVRNMRNTQRTTLINRIVGNQRNSFSRKELIGMSTPMLTKLASSIGVVNQFGAHSEDRGVALYTGAAAPATNQSSGNDVDEDMVPPVINWAEESRLNESARRKSKQA